MRTSHPAYSPTATTAFSLVCSTMCALSAENWRKCCPHAEQEYEGSPIWALRWLLRLENCAKACPHTSHLKGSGPKCSFMWFLRWVCLVNVFEQILQRNGSCWADSCGLSSPVWTLEWSSRSVALSKASPHRRQAKDAVPCSWILTCVRSVEACAKPSPHVPQAKGLSPVWMRICVLSS
uniref:Putative secreted protein n=1 Tax=Ixodes ricinus TaxID=34613 RepID=A0A147BLM4_IXORI